MRRKAVPEGVAANALGEFGCPNCLFDCFLSTAFVQMMPTHQPVAWMLGDLTSGKHILPDPLAASVGILAQRAQPADVLPQSLGSNPVDAYISQHIHCPSELNSSPSKLEACTLEHKSRSL
jgi:hypothetical protein